MLKLDIKEVYENTPKVEEERIYILACYLSERIKKFIEVPENKEKFKQWKKNKPNIQELLERRKLSHICVKKVALEKSQNQNHSKSTVITENHY